MHDCHRPDSQNSDSPTCRSCAGECTCVCARFGVYVCVHICVCVCVLFTFRLVSVPKHIPQLHTGHLYALYLPIHIYLRPKPQYILRLVPCRTQQSARSLARSLASAAACSNTVSDLKETRDGELEDAGMAPRLHFFNYSTWRIEEPKTEQGPFCCVNDPRPPFPINHLQRLCLCFRDD